MDKAASTLATKPAPHGRLAVRGGRLCGLKHQQPVSLAGVSFFWSQWMPAFYDAVAVGYFATEWKATLVRAAVGVHESSGYLANPQTELAKAERVLEAAIAHGLYCIIDWHDHHAEQHTEEACNFFADVARRYGRHEHLIYEIFNEPLDVPWSTIKAYASRVIAAIRAHDPSNLIIVGTPCWSQHVDVAAAAPLADANVAYALHFYAGTHGAELRQRAERALAAGACVFVSEWGTVDASGDGAVARAAVDEWVCFLRAHGLSHAAWAVSDKAEGASIFAPGAAAAVGAWGEEHLTLSGRCVREIVRGSSDALVERRCECIL